jgi:hypothetical protein
MEALREITSTINIFVRFFESINCLFWQINWLRQNFQSSPNDQMIIVVIIILVCVYITFFSNTNGSSVVMSMINKFLPQIFVGSIIFGLLIWLIARRYSRNTPIAEEIFPEINGVKHNRDDIEASAPLVHEGRLLNVTAASEVIHPNEEWSRYPGGRRIKNQV